MYNIMVKEIDILDYWMFVSRGEQSVGCWDTLDEALDVVDILLNSHSRSSIKIVKEFEIDAMPTMKDRSIDIHS